MINISNIKKQVKVNYLKASRRLAGLSLLQLMCQKSLSFLTQSGADCPAKTRKFIQTSVKNIIGWLSSIQRPDEDSKQLLLFHYMDDVKGCGI
jgi:hypothetical protein